MTGRVGAVDVTAGGAGRSLGFRSSCSGQGLLLAVTPCVAQLRGAGSMRSGEHMQGVGHVMRQGIWMALFISVPLIIIVYLEYRSHLADMGVEGSLGLMTGQYLRAIIWGAPAYLLFVALRCGMNGAYAPGDVRGLYGAAHQYPMQLHPDFRQVRPPGARRAGYGRRHGDCLLTRAMFLTMVVYASRHPTWGTDGLAGMGTPA